MTVSNLLPLQSALLSVIEPVLDDMPAGVLQHALVEAFRSQVAELVDIERSFKTLTARHHSAASLRTFFGSWSKTRRRWVCRDDGRSGRAVRCAGHLHRVPPAQG